MRIVKPAVAQREDEISRIGLRDLQDQTGFLGKVSLFLMGVKGIYANYQIVLCFCHTFDFRLFHSSLNNSR